MRKWMPIVVLVAFLLAPAAEIAVLVLMGQHLGWWPTLIILVVTVILGGILVKHEGLRTWRAITEAVRRGEVPTAQMLDGVVLLLGGLLLLLPGFISDVLALICLIPFTRGFPR